MACLLHEEPAALLPVPLQKLLQCLGLAGRVQHTRYSVRRAPPTLVSPAPAGQRDADQVGGALPGVDGVRGNLVLKMFN